MTDFLDRLNTSAPISDSIVKLTTDALQGVPPNHHSAIVAAADEQGNVRIVAAVRAGEHWTFADSFERQADGELRNVAMVRASW